MAYLVTVNADVELDLEEALNQVAGDELMEVGYQQVDNGELQKLYELWQRGERERFDEAMRDYFYRYLGRIAK